MVQLLLEILFKNRVSKEAKLKNGKSWTFLMGGNHKIQSLNINEEALQNHPDIACFSPTGVLLENYFRFLSTKLSIKEKLDIVQFDFI